MSDLPLNPLRVLVTRPTISAQPLANCITKLGGQPILFPTLEIIPTLSNTQLKQQLDELPPPKWAIFTSQNAVPPVMAIWPIIGAPKIATVGASTANCLKQYHIQVEAYPKQDFSSEGLLNLPAFQNPKGTNIVIFTGENGRGLLEEELTQRGALITTITVYKRQKPAFINTDTLAEWQQGFDIIISTSNESLTNLIDLTPVAYQTQLLNTPLLVISPRMQSYAEKCGFCSIITASNPTQNAILATLKAWYARGQG